MVIVNTILLHDKWVVIRAKRVSNCYIPKKKIVRVRLILVLVGKKLCVCSTNLGFSVGYVLCTRYVCTTLYETRYVLCTRYVWFQVRIMYQIRTYHTCRCIINSTAVSLFVYSLVGGGITRTFRPWTHTFDDSYIYQLSLVVATATVFERSEFLIATSHKKKLCVFD